MGICAFVGCMVFWSDNIGAFFRWRKYTEWFRRKGQYFGRLYCRSL